MATEVAEQREDIEEIRRVISLMNERFKSIEGFMRRERDNCFGWCGTTTSEFGLEQKVFPTMWPTIHRVESVVGDLHDHFENNPLDRKQKPLKES